MKIALCYFGVLRSFNKVLESHEIHIYEVFKKNNIDFRFDFTHLNFFAI